LTYCPQTLRADAQTISVISPVSVVQCMIGVVITFDDAEYKAWVTVSESNLDQFIGHEASFQFSKTKDFKGTVLGVEDDFLVVKFQEQPLGLGQGSQVSIAD